MSNSRDTEEEGDGEKEVKEEKHLDHTVNKTIQFIRVNSEEEDDERFHVNLNPTLILSRDSHCRSNRQRSNQLLIRATFKVHTRY